MNGCTINIADFRCRATSRITSIDRTPRRVQTFEVVGQDRDGDLIQDAILQEDPTVYDIGIAREVQRTRHRAVFRPISIQRKANVLRFRNEVPVEFKIRAEERRAECWSSRPDGPCDPPPAA